MAPAAPPTPAPVPGLLDQQAARRHRGVPTVSALRGPPGPALRQWRRWAAARQQPHLLCTDPGLTRVVRLWAGQLARGRDLVSDAVAALARRAGRPVAALRAALAGKTPADLVAFWEALPLDRSSDAVSVSAALVGCLVAGEELAPTQALDRLAPGLKGCDPPEPRVVAALCGLVPERACPAVLLAPEDPGTGPGGGGGDGASVPPTPAPRLRRTRRKPTSGGRGARGGAAGRGRPPKARPTRPSRSSRAAARLDVAGGPRPEA
jgi:hypothetical protein